MASAGGPSSALPIIVTVNTGGHSHVFEVDLADTLEVFLMQVFSVCEVPLESLAFEPPIPLSNLSSLAMDCGFYDGMVLDVVPKLPMAPSQLSQAALDMERTLRASLSTVMLYEDAGLQAEARAVMPPSILQLSTAVPQDTEGLVRALLRWFKTEFFTWVNAPPCITCGGATTNCGMGQPTASEAASGAGRVELYACSGSCPPGALTRFPRYNAPGTLLKTRRGRCGEWANAFTLCCRAVGVRARYVRDWTDHVWTEVYLPNVADGQCRWTHADSCENALDRPLMYEKGWGKKLNYVVALSCEEVIDVTKRYTRRVADVWARRRLLPEHELEWVLTALDAEVRQRRRLPTERQNELMAERLGELSWMARHSSLPYDDEVVLPGRESGSLEWRQQRGELGESSSSSSSSASSSAEPLSLSPSAIAACSRRLLALEAFDGSSIELLQVVGSAAVCPAVDGKSALWLTPRANDKVGGAWLVRRLGTSTSFVSEFMFSVTGDADGFAFVVQAEGPSALGAGGCGMGYEGLRTSLAVEFDIYASVDTCSDPNGNHVSIQSRGLNGNSPHHSHSLGCVASSTQLPKLNSGAIHSALILYDCESSFLTVAVNGKAVVGARMVLSDLCGSERVWVGFTAATGGLNAAHVIHSWRLATGPLPEDAELTSKAEEFLRAGGESEVEGRLAGLVLLSRYAANVVAHPGVLKYTRIVATNKALQRLIGWSGGEELLVRTGFERTESGEEFVWGGERRRSDTEVEDDYDRLISLVAVVELVVKRSQGLLCASTS